MKHICPLPLSDFNMGPCKLDLCLSVSKINSSLHSVQFESPGFSCPLNIDWEPFLK